MPRGLLIAVFVASCVAPVHGQNQPADVSIQSNEGQALSRPTTADQVVERIIAREHNEISTIRSYHPLVETYIQEEKADNPAGSPPVRDHYFLGQANLANGVVSDTILTQGHPDALNPLSHVSSLFKAGFVPEGFLQMIYLDANDFDLRHYRFDYVRQEFVGDVKCAVFDITPLPKSGRGRFNGRIWAEEQDYTIVRFNGTYTAGNHGINGYQMHFDSWRENVQPGLWLPAYVYAREAKTKYVMGGHVRFVAQTRLWGYDLARASHDSDLSELTVESPSVQDAAGAEQDRGPVEAERDWQQEATLNVLDDLQRNGFVSPPGEVDKLLDTVLNNLEVTNNMNIEPEPHCRVLLTSSLELFSIGHTIVLSRGLIDVLPDEASLAAMIAQELADMIVTDRSVDMYGFPDETQVATVDVLSHFSFQDSPAEIQRASEKAAEILKNSPYKDNLGNAGLFLKQLDAESKSLSALINPHLGNRVHLAQQLMAAAPPLQPNKVDQIAALPIGARLRLDPWTDRLALLKAKPVPLYGAWEKMPFGITPFMPFLTSQQLDERRQGGEGAASGRSTIEHPH
jgi:hypothetical protein